MELEKFCNILGFDGDYAEKLAPYYCDLYAKSSDELPFFMKREFFTEYYPLCRRNDNNEIFARMAEVCAEAEKNPVVCRYALMIYYALFVSEKPLLSFPWLAPEKIFGENEGIFPLLIALGALPLIRQKHAEIGLDESYMHGIADWIGVTLDIYAAAHNGIKGHPFRMTYWLRYSIDCELFRIGRLEFFDSKYYADMPFIYRNRNNGKLAVLCRNNWTFDKDGFRVKSDSNEVDFTAELCEENGVVSGIWIDPCGFPVKDKKITLDLAQWELVCAEDEICSTLHIPGGGGMTLERIRESLVMAKKFYREVFKREVKFFCCHSVVLYKA